MRGGAGDCEDGCWDCVCGVEIEKGGVETAGGGEEGDVEVHVRDF